MSCVPVSYVIVGFNSGRYIPGCLRTVIADAPPNSEVVFIDNASSDDTISIIERDFPSVRLIKNDTNIGHCRATNQGFRAARGRHVMLLDADTELEEGATESMVAFLEGNPDAVLCAPRLRDGAGRIQETARKFPTVVNAVFGRQTLATRLFPNNRFTDNYLGRHNLGRKEPFAVEWVSSACMMFPRRILESIGFWDEGFVGYWVDCDWCKTIQENGGGIFCVPGATVWHFEQFRPRRKKSLRRIVMFNRGVLRFYTKHHTLGRFDPRALAAAFFLTARSTWQLMENIWADRSGDADVQSSQAQTAVAAAESGNLVRKAS